MGRWATLRERDLALTVIWRQAGRCLRAHRVARCRHCPDRGTLACVKVRMSVEPQLSIAEVQRFSEGVK